MTTPIMPLPSLKCVLLGSKGRHLIILPAGGHFSTTDIKKFRGSGKTSLLRRIAPWLDDKRSDPALPRALKKEIDGKMFYLTIHDSQGGDHNPFLLKDDPLFHNVDLFLDVPIVVVGTHKDLLDDPRWVRSLNADQILSLVSRKRAQTLVDKVSAHAYITLSTAAGEEAQSTFDLASKVVVDALKKHVGLNKRNKKLGGVWFSFG